MLRRTTRILVGIVAAFCTFAAEAELGKVTIARQDGIQYLPLMIMQAKGLGEKHAKAQGLRDVSVEWIRFAGGNDMNDAILSGRAQFGTAGVPPFHGRSQHELLRAQLTEPPQPLSSRRYDVPVALSQVIMQSLEKSPDAGPRQAGG